MKTRRPSPALVISIVALVMSTTGSAIAAKVIISNSSQVKTGALNGTDIADGSLGIRDLSAKAVAAIAKKATAAVPAPTGDPTSAVAVSRKSPTARNEASKQATVATLQAVPAGAYVVTAKATLASAVSSPDLLTQTLQPNRTAFGHCVLDVPGGATDEATGPIASQFALTPVTLQTQLVRTLNAPGDMKLNCDAGVPWTASDISLIAVKVASVASS